MRKIGLLSASSAFALAVALSSSPASAFNAVDWNWNSDNATNVLAEFSLETDFVGWGLTQVERLQVMAGNMTAYADGSNAEYTGAGGYYDTSGVAPIYIVNKQYVDSQITQAAAQTAENGPLLNAPNSDDNIIVVNDVTADVDTNIEQTITQDASILAKQVNHIYVDLGDAAPWQTPINALDHLAKVEISATAISNVGSIDGQHVTMAHDGQLAFGGFNEVGGDYENGDNSTEQAIMANLDLANWIDHDNFTYGTSGNSNYDMLLLGWTASQYGLLEKGYNTAVANGNDIYNAAADVNATSAANIHTVSVDSIIESGPYGEGYTSIASDNIAMVDLNQFGFMDTYAQATAMNHSVHGYSHLGQMEAPVLKVTASALGNVSTVTNKFGGSAE